MSSSRYKYDAFISHAVEDKQSIANELCRRLKEGGLKIWYSGGEFNVGDSIEKSIYRALKESRYGIVVISRKYLNKTWTMQEFSVLRSRETEYEKIILPILHQITLDEFIAIFPEWADRFTVSSERGMDFVTEVLVKEIKRKPEAPVVRINRNRLLVGFICLALLLIVAIFLGYYYRWDKPSRVLIKTTVQKRIDNFQRRIEDRYLLPLKASGGEPVSMETVDSVFATFTSLQTYYRNEYEFDDGFNTIRFKKNVETALQMEMERLTPHTAYQFSSPDIYLRKTAHAPPEVTYAFVNTLPVTYTVTEVQPVDDCGYRVDVTYTDNIRYVTVNLVFAASAADMKKHRVTILGFQPRETYMFEEQRGEWVFKGVE